MNLVGYCRASSEDQSDSVNQQTDALNSYAQELNHNLLQIYADDARSGTTIKGRDEFQSMIGSLVDMSAMPPKRLRKDIDGILLWHVDRFARNSTESRLYRTALEVTGYQLLYVADEIPEGIAGELTIAVNEHSAAEYSKKLGKAVRRGLLARVKNGKAVGRAPTGYRYTEEGIWEPDPSIFHLVQQAWKMRADGYSIREIHSQTKLYSLHPPYLVMFRNPIYMGTWDYQSLVTEKYVEPACTPEQFNTVQQMMDAHADRSGWANGRHPRNSDRYLLSGLIYCGLCGSRMKVSSSLRSGNAYAYYLCSHRYIDCNARFVRVDWIEGEVLNYIDRELLAPELIPIIYEKAITKHLKSQQGRVQKEEYLIERTRTLSGEISRLTDAIASGKSPPSIVDSIMERQTHLEILQSELAGLEVSTPEFITLEEFTARSNELRQALREAPRRRIKNILHQLISRIDAT